MKTELQGFDDFATWPLVRIMLGLVLLGALAFLMFGCQSPAQKKTEQKVQQVTQKKAVDAAEHPLIHTVYQVQTILVPVQHGLTWLNLLAIVATAIAAGLSFENATSAIGKLLLPPSLMLLGLTFVGLLVLSYWWIVLILVGVLAGVEVYLQRAKIFGIKITTPAPPKPA